MKKRKLFYLLLVGTFLAGCKSNPTKPTENPSHEEDLDGQVNTAISFDGIETPEDYQKYIDGVRKSGAWYNGPSEYGIVTSPDYEFYISNDNKWTEYPVYAANITEGLNSFIEVKKSTETVKCKIVSNDLIKSVNVYHSLGEIEYKISNMSLNFTISEATSYTFVFNNNLLKPITVFLENEVKKTETINTHEVTERIIEPGKLDETIVCKPFERIVIKAGKHQLRNIVGASNSEVYFEDGAYVECLNPSSETETPIDPKDWAGMTRFRAFIYAANTENFKVYGHGIIDLAKVSWHGRVGIDISYCNNFYCSDIMYNNCSEWNMCIGNTSNIFINNVKIFGYRENSDCIDIVDCNTAYVDNCFGNSGDDIFQVKSMDANSKIEIGNIHYSNCVAWSGKVRGIGITGETVRNVQDVHFKNCVIIANKSNWMDELGACVVYSLYGGHVSNIYFENIRINNSTFYPINVTMQTSATGSIKNIHFKNIIYDGVEKIRINNRSSKVIENIEFINVFNGDSQINDDNSYFFKSGVIGDVNIEYTN